MIIIELEYKDHKMHGNERLECGCLVYDVEDENNLRLLLCPGHKEEMSSALKQSIISKSKQ